MTIRIGYASTRLLLLILLIRVDVSLGSVSSRARAFFHRTENHRNGAVVQSSIEQATNTNDDESVVSRKISQGMWSNFWPPWPFTMLKDHPPMATDSTASSTATAIVQSASNSSPSALGQAWLISKRSARVAARNFQEVGSQLWFHLPPAAPPLVLLACLPRTEHISATAAEAEVVTKTVLPILSNPFVRSMALSGAALAFCSWAHSEVWRKRRLTVLPLAYRDINRAILPPSLPEAVPVCLLPRSSGSSAPLNSNRSDDNNTAQDDDEPNDNTRLPPRLQRHWKQFRNSAPKARSLKAAIQDYLHMYNVRSCERRNAVRLAIYDELVALQTLKARQRRRTTLRHSKRPDTNDDEALGYALVTGASKGIGRALAVELARWEIPLILVARNANALAALAYDLETCYGIDCYVVPTDLTQETAAQRLYQRIQKAGLKVDFLINNAGIAAHGDVLDHSLEEIDQVIQLNTGSLLTLTHLFGRDMRDRQRGRILMVSSICGAVSGIASVAVYSATKAFANSFGTALAKEMEPHGVGVTCLLPGAVKGTDFGVQSNSQQALCWKIPFYSKTAATVAEAGVRAMLHGDTEVTPGVLNRLFLKVVKPLSPPRLHNLIAETMWKPVVLPAWVPASWRRDSNTTTGTDRVNEALGDEFDQIDDARVKAMPVRPSEFLHRSFPESKFLELEEPQVPTGQTSIPSRDSLPSTPLDIAENQSAPTITNNATETMTTPTERDQPAALWKPLNGSLLPPAYENKVNVPNPDDDMKASESEFESEGIPPDSEGSGGSSRTETTQTQPVISRKDGVESQAKQNDGFVESQAKPNDNRAVNNIDQHKGRSSVAECQSQYQRLRLTYKGDPFDSFFPER